MFCKYLVSCIFWRSVIGFLMKYLICFSEIYWKSEIYSIIYLFFIIKIQFLDSGCYFWQSFQFFSFLYSVSVPKCGSKRFFDLFKSRWNMWTKRWSLLLTVLAYFLLLTYFEWQSSVLWSGFKSGFFFRNWLGFFVPKPVCCIFMVNLVYKQFLFFGKLIFSFCSFFIAINKFCIPSVKHKLPWQAPAKATWLALSWVGLACCTSVLKQMCSLFFVGILFLQRGDQKIEIPMGEICCK